MRTVLLTALALVGFAANSLLCRAALAGGENLIDAASFTLLRLYSGMLMLLLLLRVRGRRPQGGTWGSAIALFAYAACFSLAYLRIPAGVGALILFGCVQATMLGTAIVRGERPTLLEWLGLLLALGGLVGLTAPGASAPDLLGAALMASAGVAWGAYSLRGRGSTDPLANTARNFTFATFPAQALWVMRYVIQGSLHFTAQGIALAVASGALASGVGYTLWYAVLPLLTATRAAIVQLSVPVLAATGGVLLLGEHVTVRLVAAGSALLCGVLLALAARSRKPVAVAREQR